MTEVFCAAALDEHGPVPGIAPCAEFGTHRVICPDHEMNATRPETCQGCAPRPAERQHLCTHHYEWAFAARVEWDRWESLVHAADGRTVSPTGMGGQALGYSNLSLVALTLDECRRHLASSHGVTFDVWVSTYEGAADALQFAAAANRAYRTLEVEEQPTRFERVRCPSCGLLSLSENPTREVRGATTVECQHCGHELVRVKTPVDRWAGSRECQGGAHLDCDRANCACACHNLGVVSRPSGVTALFDADLTALGFTDRSAWIAYPGGRIYEAKEEAA